MASRPIFKLTALHGQSPTPSPEPEANHPDDPTPYEYAQGFRVHPTMNGISPAQKPHYPPQHSAPEHATIRTVSKRKAVNESPDAEDDEAQPTRKLRRTADGAQPQTESTSSAPLPPTAAELDTNATQAEQDKASFSFLLAVLQDPARRAIMEEEVDWLNQANAEADMEESGGEGADITDDVDEKEYQGIHSDDEEVLKADGNRQKQYQCDICDRRKKGCKGHRPVCDTCVRFNCADKCTWTKNYGPSGGAKK